MCISDLFRHVSLTNEYSKTTPSIERLRDMSTSELAVHFETLYVLFPLISPDNGDQQVWFLEDLSTILPLCLTNSGGLWLPGLIVIVIWYFGPKIMPQDTPSIIACLSLSKMPHSVL